MKFKKAAMFGLDARIALAIFGALSVISGAALYSAIQQAKVTQIMTQTNNIAMAIEQYLLDTGSLPPNCGGTSAFDLDITALTTKPSGVTGWQGPYIALEENGVCKLVRPTDSKNIILSYSNSQEWADEAADERTCKKSGVSCSLYVIYQTTRDLEDELEAAYDGNDNKLAGKFRARSTDTFIDTGISFDKANAITN
tara:strand:+ start:5005 stop:5595 length:591 start_codon:yes stop_codon:yes gene_type:complete